MAATRTSSDYGGMSQQQVPARAPIKPRGVLRAAGPGEPGGLAIPFNFPSTLAVWPVPRVARPSPESDPISPPSVVGQVSFLPPGVAKCPCPSCLSWPSVLVLPVCGGQVSFLPSVVAKCSSSRLVWPSVIVLPVCRGQVSFLFVCRGQVSFLPSVVAKCPSSRLVWPSVPSVWCGQASSGLPE